MASRTVLGLKHLVAQGKPLTNRKMASLRKQLRGRIKRPSIQVEGDGHVRRGDTLEIRADPPVLPSIDYYAAKLVKTGPEGLALPVVASFQSANGLIHVPVKADVKSGVFTMTVPKKARSGDVLLQMPPAAL